MTAAAFIHADGGIISPELRQLIYIREFGVPAVMGRDWLGYGEMIRMRHAQFIVESYQERKRADNWEAWAKDNPEAAQLLFDAQKLVEKPE